MAIRLTTWNVNGIRNPFGYQPWRDKRSFEAMFDILEADIVCLQETKIQRKDLQDDMVLVPGFDCYWSLPRHKKGYSGVVIYTRNSKCAPIRAEEGITGILSPPNSEACYRDLDRSEQIGGYPTLEQISEVDIDLAALDSEGRCVVLEFPAFVLLGTYCPAERDETRTHFRTAFLKLLDWRIRNLSKLGKNVVWMGDLNISSNAIDTAMAEEMQRKNGVDHIGWVSTPARRLFNQLIVEGEVHGSRDEGREAQVMWDVCRDFHRGRKGMYTCWETKVNARPGNYGARIDYIVCSYNMRDWWLDSNIQEGLMGSDHCPVYAVLKDKITFDGKDVHVLDIMNPPNMFENGIRKRNWNNNCLLPMSGRLITEFDKRRSIKDMFTKRSPGKLSLLTDSAAVSSGNSTPSDEANMNHADFLPCVHPPESQSTTSIRLVKSSTNSTSKHNSMKRPLSTVSSPPVVKRSKTDSVSRGQQSLKGFFTSTASSFNETFSQPVTCTVANSTKSASSTPAEAPAMSQQARPSPSAESKTSDLQQRREDDDVMKLLEDSALQDAARTSWNQVFARPVAPECEHKEPCKSMLTKKPGVNCGRSFWMCARPLGPSGQKEKNTQWRCSTFVWCSDWNARQKVDC